MLRFGCTRGRLLSLSAKQVFVSVYYSLFSQEIMRNCIRINDARKGFTVIIVFACAVLSVFIHFIFKTVVARLHCINIE